MKNPEQKAVFVRWTTQVMEALEPWLISVVREAIVTEQLSQASTKKDTNRLVDLREKAENECVSERQAAAEKLANVVEKIVAEANELGL